MVIRRKTKSMVKAEAKAESHKTKAKPSQSKVVVIDPLEDREVADDDGPPSSNADAEALKPIEAENEGETTCGSEQDNMADLEAHSRDGLQNTEGESTAMQEDIGKMSVEVTAHRTPYDNVTDLRGTSADEKERSRDDFSNFEADEIEETVKLEGTIMGNEHEDRKETPKKLESGEEESATELNNDDFVGAPLFHEREKNADENGANKAADVEASDKGVSLIKSQEETNGLATAKELSDGKVASTCVTRPYVTENVAASDSSKEVVEAGEGHVGLSEGHLPIEKNEESLNGDVTIGNVLEENPRKKVKKIVKRLVRRKVLVNPGRDEPQSSVIPEDAEQEKEKVHSAVNMTKKIVKKVVKRKPFANQARVEPSPSEVPENFKAKEDDILKCETKHDERKPNNKVNNARRVIGKKKVLRKNGVPVTGKDESELVGKGKVVIENETLNRTNVPESADGDTKAGSRDSENVEESGAVKAGKDERVESGAGDKKPIRNNEGSAVEENESRRVAEASMAKSSEKGKSSKKLESQGMIFMCTSKTKIDCIRYKVLGLPSSKKEMVSKVYKGMRLFLFDVDSRKLYGIYKAAGRGGYNLEPKAFNSSFPSQVRYTVLNDCPPLPEVKFKQAIKDNYFTKNKFSCELKSEQVKNLCKLFQQGKVTPRAAAKPVKEVSRGKAVARGVDISLRRVHVQGRAQDASRQGGSRKRSRADEMREGRKRRKARDDEKRERDRRRNSSAELTRHYHRPLPMGSSDYSRHPVGYERRAYSPPLVYVDPFPPALRPPREASPPPSYSSYDYERTSILDSYRRDHHARDHQRGRALEYSRHDSYNLYRDPVAYVDPYAGGRNHNNPYYPSSSRPEHYSPRTSRDDYFQSGYRVPPPPYRRY